MISLVVAHGNKNEIGYKNELLWKLPRDMKHFKELTTGGTVLMGRKTYESIGRPLPNRHNIILTRTVPSGYVPNTENLEWHTDVYEAWELSKAGREIFIIGGEMVYKAFLPFADRLYITMVEGNFKADSYFPPYVHLLDKFNVTDYNHVKADENNPYDMRFITYEKIR